jgi:hypothetical protein
MLLTLALARNMLRQTKNSEVYHETPVDTTMDRHFSVEKSVAIGTHRIKPSKKGI